MDQVKELLGLIKGMKMNGAPVAASFIVRRIQPCKERAHLSFDFKGDTDGTQLWSERLTKEAVLRWAAELFAPNMSFSVLGQPRAFNCMNPPPQVKISTVGPSVFLSCVMPSSKLIHLWEDPFVGKDGVLLGHAEERLAKGSGC